MYLCSNLVLKRFKLSVGRFFLFISRKFIRCTSAHFHITVGRLAFVADFEKQNFHFKTKFNMENNTSINHENGNDANRLLAVRFISENIIVDRFPVSKEIKADGKHKDCQVVINVSDEFYLGISEEIMKEGKLNYYFPMGESGELMGLNSMFGALQVLHQIYTWNPEWKVLIHCQAGKNRSPTIKSAFHYMMLGEHEADKTKEGGRNNRLIDNCKREHLPQLKKTELFLSKCKEAFDNPEKFFGVMFDWVMSESGCSLK